MTTSRIVVPALLVAGLLAPGTQAAAQTFMFERSFPATASTRLDVTTNRGKITVHAGATADVVVVGRVSVRVAWNSPGNAVALARSTANQPPVEQTGDTIRLQIPRDGRTRRAVTIAYEVLVPAGIRVVTHSESGETRVDGVRGTVSVRTQSGAITLADLGATRVDTGSGAVSIDGAGPLSVTTSSSGIEMTRISGNLDVRTQSGRVTASLVNEGDSLHPGFPFCQPDQGLHTPTRLSARQISSAHVIPLPTPVRWGRARRETDWSPCFQGISQAPLHTCALSSPLRCTQAARQPPGTGSAQILRSMSPNSRRVRCPSASRSQ